ncbi:hypothetical protein [Helicobacter pylori]|nr:hypothetical protein [Helicobacter pylori]
MQEGIKGLIKGLMREGIKGLMQGLMKGGIIKSKGFLSDLL